jgi:hypothetical protein
VAAIEPEDLERKPGSRLDAESYVDLARRQVGKWGQSPLEQKKVSQTKLTAYKGAVPIFPVQTVYLRLRQAIYMGLRARINALMNLPSTCGAIASKSIP